MSLLDLASRSAGEMGTLLPGDTGALLGDYIAQNTRLLEGHFATDSGIPDGKLLIRSLSGFEAINESFRYEAQCLSADAYIPLKALEGVPIQLMICTDRGAKREINGVVTEARSEGTDGSLASYRLVIEPVTSVLKLGRTSRVFQGKSYLQVAILLLEEEIQVNPVFASCLSVDNRCKGEFPAREFIFLCDENKWDFIQRCFAKSGVSYVFAPAKDGSTEFPQHTLILVNDSHDLDENEAGIVRFHRADGTEHRDAVTQWHARRTLQCGRVTRRRWDHNRGSLCTTTEALASDQGPFGNALVSTIDEYTHDSPLEHDDLQVHEARTVIRAQAREQRTKSFAGESSVRDFRAGTRFVLTQHPVHDQDPAGSREFVLTRVELDARNNLPKGLEDGLKSLAKGVLADGGAVPSGPVYRNHFECIRLGIPILPEEIPPPAPGYLTGTVVGPANEAVHTDSLGRIKVRLHGAREEEHPEAGASGTDRDSFWIRLMQPWSSQGMGGNLIARVGDEVLLAALHNDPDKLVAVGVLPGGVRMPGRFSEVSELPGDKAISGFRSRAHGGIEGNEILMDDTPRELRARIASDHACTALNLGCVVHPRKNGAAAPKGEGAELRTDAAVAIRGGRGVFISADARPNAGGSQLSRDEALGHLNAALELTRTLGDLGGKHGVDALETKPQADLLKAVEDWEKGTRTDPKGQGGKSPILLGSAPAGVALSSGNDATVQAGSNLDLVAMRHAQLSAGKRLLFHAMESIGLFAHRLGMKLIAASGDISIQAQDGLTEMIAAKVLRLMSVGGPIELDAAEGIVMRSGGAYLKIKDGTLELGAPAGFTGRASSVSWSGPESQEALMRSFGKSQARMDDFFRIHDQAGEPIANRRYRITKEDGTSLEGMTDGDGCTQVVRGKVPEKWKIMVFPKEPKA